MPRDVEGSIAKAILHEYELLTPRYVVIDKVSDPLAKHLPAILSGRLRRPSVAMNAAAIARSESVLFVGSSRLSNAALWIGP